MRTESIELLQQASADAFAARDAQTIQEYWNAMRDCFGALAQVPLDDTEAQNLIAIARAELCDVMERLFSPGDDVGHAD